MTFSEIMYLVMSCESRCKKPKYYGHKKFMEIKEDKNHQNRHKSKSDKTKVKKTSSDTLLPLDQNEQILQGSKKAAKIKEQIF